ncbi:hypothetical protein H257_06496 [Aphanomyces astaci]|uniref:Uncharacterized protein n=1 Tax=Aphanomyces astaci TaxID=112090 RepID=W4GMJ6_APHAT|nr:hypothetical protein H257_06496 [Aphanomyces astaci]ETV80108.1 hypothetical protein H257_06496 [Aphanomyces astaci]|eukprot:XP_009830032.1 hypothetical protein H257_06496 [Aphanomyces astaci]
MSNRFLLLDPHVPPSKVCGHPRQATPRIAKELEETKKKKRKDQKVLVNTGAYY